MLVYLAIVVAFVLGFWFGHWCGSPMPADAVDLQPPAITPAELRAELERSHS